MQRRWDIFCTVIDNFGDAGVCWRLARQLAAEHRLEVRLWIDDLHALQRLWPELAIDAPVQYVAGVEVRAWRERAITGDVADVVIEAFACTLPAAYVTAMAQCVPPPLWINLEYLSAEPWVRECHGLASPQAQTVLHKYFFFPGFGAGTGGLLCEHDLRARRLQFEDGAHKRANWLSRWGLEIDASTIVISLFAYPFAPLREWLEVMAAGTAPVLCLVPEGGLLEQVATYFEVPSLGADAVLTRGALTLAVLPFLRQDEYDTLLWACDLNCVRGEDSFVRAQWAARPLLWHIYPQDVNAHWPKLEAFLALYIEELAAADVKAADALLQAMRAWNGRGNMAACWPALREALPALRRGAQQWERRLHEGPNLAAALAQFCANNV